VEVLIGGVRVSRILIVVVLFCVAPARADESDDGGWRPTGATSMLMPSAEPVPSVLAPPNPGWQNPGATEVLTQTGRPPAPDAGAGAADGEAQQDNGTNPASNARTVIVRNECSNLEGGNRINTTYLSLKFPCLDRRGALIVEVPFNYYDFIDPVAVQLSGLGDVKFQLNYNAWVSEDKRTTVLTMLEMFIPSADEVLIRRAPDPNRFVAQSIGTGKYVYGLGTGLVFAIQKNFLFAPLYFYEESFAGADNRPDIRRGKLRVFLMYAWPNGAYVLPEFQVATDFVNSNNDTYAAWEVGYSTKGSTFYVKPGCGLNPDFGDRRWGVEFGVRVQF
jgi:hypothetical protein